MAGEEGELRPPLLEPGRGDLARAADVDAERFDALVDRQPAEAAQLLRGEFLEGFALDEAPGFDEWAGNTRARFHARAAAALTAAGEGALGAFRYAEAIDLARRALAYEPYAEPAARLLMRAAALSGDIAGALAAFQDFSARMASQLGERPGRALSDLAERVRSMRWRRSTALRAAEEPALVGREALYREAFAVVEAGLRGGPRTLLVTGDPGAGRTRLLVECGERLALGGAVLASARPLESDRESPWSTLRALLRGGLLRAPGSTAVDPGVLAALGDAATPRDAAEMATALAALLRAIADEQPVGISVDDAHFADGPSLGALEVALGELRRSPSPVVLVVTALHGWDGMPRELVRLSAAVGRSLPGSALRLEPFTEEEARLLVLGSSPWCQAEADRDRLARRVFFETAGNPFLIVTSPGRRHAAPSRRRCRSRCRVSPGARSWGAWPSSIATPFACCRGRVSACRGSTWSSWPRSRARRATPSWSDWHCSSGGTS
ncbi:MAG: hypothetical protein DMD67_12975 [Gemmatimonadetes bacterium]|nr:MAG: hypothetical protein DMD67_12975 [Gemmatimonadota bacterium]